MNLKCVEYKHQKNGLYWNLRNNEERLYISFFPIGLNLLISISIIFIAV